MAGPTAVTTPTSFFSIYTPWGRPHSFSALNWGFPECKGTDFPRADLSAAHFETTADGFVVVGNSLIFSPTTDALQNKLWELRRTDAGVQIAPLAKLPEINLVRNSGFHALDRKYFNCWNIHPGFNQHLSAEQNDTVRAFFKAVENTFPEEYNKK